MASFEELSVGTSIPARIAEAKRVCEVLNNLKLKEESTYTPWIRFEVGDLVIDTADPKNQYFMSLDYTKNGSGSANSFQLVIGYEPKPANLYGKMYDPSTIDKQIVKATEAENKDDKLKCRLQYGYSLADGHKLVHPKTEGQLLDYNVEIREGLLTYTLTGYSSVVKSVEKKISVEAKQKVKPTTAVKEVLEKELGDLGYKVTVVNDNDGTVENIEEMSDISIWQYVDTVLKYAVPEGTSNDSTDSETRPYYSYNIIEDDGNKEIQIILVDTTKVDDDKLMFTFNWMDKGDNLVLDFQTEFKGSVVLAQKFNEGELEPTAYGISESGEIIETKRSGPALVVDDDSENSQDKEESADKTTWAKATQYSYKATLTTVGIPADIPISSYIYITPLIYGVAHHTKGKYMVTKSTDRIDSGGFQSTLELIKIGKQEKAKSSESSN